MFYQIERDHKKSCAFIFNDIRESKFNTHFDDYSKMQNTFTNVNVWKSSSIQPHT